MAPDTAGGSAYAALLRERRLRGLLAVSQAGRLGFSMLPLAVVVFATATAGGPAAGGAALAAFSVTSAFSPARARLVDRRGPPVLAALVVAFVAALLLLLAAGELAGHAVAVAGAAALAGAVVPPLGPFTRAVIGGALRERPLAAQHAYALDAAGEEATLALGPLVVALAIALASAGVALAVAAALMLVGGLLTARNPLAGRLPADAADADAAPARIPPVAWLVIVSLLFPGAALGAIDVAVPAIARHHGATAVAGLLLAAMAVGTATAGLLAGGHRWRSRPVRRLGVVQAALALSLLPAAALPSPAALAPLLLAPGAAIGVLLVTVYLATDTLAPPGAATRAFAWLVTANNGGIAVGAALAGAFADGHPAAGLWVAAAAVVPGIALSAVVWRRT